MGHARRRWQVSGQSPATRRSLQLLLRVLRLRAVSYSCIAALTPADTRSNPAISLSLSQTDLTPYAQGPTILH